MQEKLLELLDAIQKHRSNMQELHSNSEFNIFSVLGVEHKEVIICRLLGEFLNPNGSHQMGAFPLICFMSQVLKLPSFSEADANQAYVCLEERIYDERRVDIVIHLGKLVWPIEVKIWAGDQEAQLCDYFHYYQNRYQLKSIYYLTPTGWRPSEQSQGNLQNEQITCISFVDGVREWLKHMLPFCRQKDVQVIIKHFIEVIDKMATSSEQLHMLRNALNVTDSQEMDMESINAALLLLSHKDEIQRDIWKKFIRVNVKCGEGIELADCEDSDLEVDKYTLLRVNRAGHTIAWICVQKNLYLYCKKTRKDANNSWHGAADSGYQWIHLSPSGHGTYQMRDNFNLKKSDIIDITYILRDIDAK